MSDPKQEGINVNLDDLKKKASDAVGKHGDQADGAIDRGGDLAKDRFGRDEQVDSATQQLKDRTGSNESDTGDENR